MFAPVLVIGLLLLIGLFGGLVVLIVVVHQRRQAQLRQRAAAAAQLGWYPVPPNPWLAQVTENLFQHGQADEMFAGDFLGRGMCVLDYTYTTNDGQTEQQNPVHVVALNLPVALPPLTLSRESGVRRIFGRRDLELESEAFNDAFRIGCADDRYASAVLHPRMMEWMLFNPGLEWQFAGNALVSWGTGHFVIADLLPRLEAMSGVVDRIPLFVLRDYGQPTYP